MCPNDCGKHVWKVKLSDDRLQNKKIKLLSPFFLDEALDVKFLINFIIATERGIRKL